MSGFTIPPNYSAKQIYHSFKAPAWTWDFLSNEPYKYACITTEIPAHSLAAFVVGSVNVAQLRIRVLKVTIVMGVGSKWRPQVKDRRV